ncbi:MAG: uroporphyrinogen-III C-methyltransferase [Gammaproteobacteria bacterium]|nr:uroporphyrinogen-III C-methyltransferase [Gammaproteobacteria bacterium]MDE0412370.1 uroporphyrinogen-III C-methyltransferase [Gammaproteobacteria bacterium]
MESTQDPLSPKPGADSQKAGHSRKMHAGPLLFVLVIVLLLAASGAGYYGWVDLNTRLDQAAVARQSIAHDIATVDESAKFQNFKQDTQEQADQLDNKLNELSGQVEQLANRQEGLREFIEETLTRVNRSQLGWGLKEALHVLHMANHRLRIERDIAGTITALDTASSRLHELNDPRLLMVRESISRQIGELKKVPNPDWAGISLQFNNLLAGVRPDIAEPVAPTAPNASQGPEPGHPELPAWKRLIEYVKDTVNRSVTVTRKDINSKVFISRQERQHAYEFLRARLLGAKYALASRDNESYHLELDAALAWLRSTDILKNTSGLIDELDELNGIDLEPELPDISEPALLLTEFLETIENR